MKSKSKTSACFTPANPLYYSSNKDLYKPEPEHQGDPVGELHTATAIIAEVKDEAAAKEIVKKVNMHYDLIDDLIMNNDLLDVIKETSIMLENWEKRDQDSFNKHCFIDVHIRINELIKKSEQK